MKQHVNQRWYSLTWKTDVNVELDLKQKLRSRIDNAQGKSTKTQPAPVSPSSNNIDYENTQLAIVVADAKEELDAVRTLVSARVPCILDSHQPRGCVVDICPMRTFECDPP